MKHSAWGVVLLVTASLNVFPPKQAIAAGVVGTGTPESCTEAALDAALTGGGSITFNCGAAPVTITVTAPILIAQSRAPAADLVGSVTVRGNTSIDGGGLVTISGALCTSGPSTYVCPDLVTIFTISRGAEFQIRNLIFSGGYTPIFNAGRVSVTNTVFSGAASIYGAIRNAGSLSVADSVFSGNTSSYLGGGAIYNSRFGPTVARRAIPNFSDAKLAKLVVTNSTFSGNRAIGGGGGGAILNLGGRVTVSDSTFTDNRADDPSPRGSYGGAIESAPGGKVTVTNSTFSGNRALWSGGAINNSGLYISGHTQIFGPLTVTNSTFSDNSVGGDATDCAGWGCNGGAIDTAGRLTVTNCTFANNSVTYGNGGALANEPNLAPSRVRPPRRAIVTNTLLANNVGGNCFAPYGQLQDGGHNLDDGATCGFTAAGSLSNTDPQLDPAGLADNGGPTPTIAIQAGSPAINAGDERVCVSKRLNSLDQRGYVRPGTGAASCSIGAYEFNSPGPPAALTP